MPLATGTATASACERRSGPTGRPHPVFPEPAPLDGPRPGPDHRPVQPEGRRRQDHDDHQPRRRARRVRPQGAAVDFDPQGALSAGLGVRPTSRRRSTTCSGRRASTADDVLHPDRRRRTSTCIPATSTSPAAEVHLVNEVAREQILGPGAAQGRDRLRRHPDRLPALARPAHRQRAHREPRRAHPARVRVLRPARRRAADRDDRQGAGPAQPGIELDGILATMYDSRTLHSREVLERVVRGVRRRGARDGDRPHGEVPGRDASPASPITSFAPSTPAAEAYRAARPGADRSRGAVACAAIAAAGEPDRWTGSETDAAERRGFRSHLDNFEGPFDLLLSLISKHKLDVTEVVAVPGHRRVHRLHPRPRAATGTSTRPPSSWSSPRPCSTSRPPGCCPQRRGGGRGGPRAARGPRPAVRPAAAVPRVQAGRRRSSPPGWPRRPGATRGPCGWSRSTPSCCPRSSSASAPEGFAGLAVKAMQPKPEPQVYVDHIHAPLVSVREQAAMLVARLRRVRRGQLPRAHRGRAGHPHRRRALPGAAGAVPGGGRRLGPGRGAGGAHGALDRRRGRRAAR